jgi:hypothetical protein
MLLPVFTSQKPKKAATSLPKLKSNQVYKVAEWRLIAESWLETHHVS